MLSPLQNLRKEFNAASSEQRLIASLAMGTFFIGAALAVWQWNDGLHYFEREQLAVQAQRERDAQKNPKTVNSLELFKSLPSGVSSSASDYVDQKPEPVLPEQVPSAGSEIAGENAFSGGNSAVDEKKLAAADAFLKSLSMSAETIASLSPEERIAIAAESQAAGRQALLGADSVSFDLSKKPKDPAAWSIVDIKEFMKAYGATDVQLKGIDEAKLRPLFVSVYNEVTNANAR